LPNSRRPLAAVLAAAATPLGSQPPYKICLTPSNGVRNTTLNVADINDKRYPRMLPPPRQARRPRAACLTAAQLRDARPQGRPSALQHGPRFAP